MATNIMKFCPLIHRAFHRSHTAFSEAILSFRPVSVSESSGKLYLRF